MSITAHKINKIIASTAMTLGLVAAAHAGDIVQPGALATGGAPTAVEQPSADKLQDILNKRQSNLAPPQQMKMTTNGTVATGTLKKTAAKGQTSPAAKPAVLSAAEKEDAPEVQKEDIAKMLLQRGGEGSVVPPETITPVEMSSSDINRIVCGSDIQDVVFSKEKNLKVKTDGKNAFVKYFITRKDGKEIYAVTPTEMYVVCNGTVYNLIVLPKRIPAQTVRLSSNGDKVKKNIALYAGKDHEKKLEEILRSVYTGEIPESMTVKKEDKSVEIFPALKVRLVRTVAVEGEGIGVKEYAVETLPGVRNYPLTEKMFLKRKLAQKILAVMVDKMNLVNGEVSRVFIVEKTGGASDVR